MRPYELPGILRHTFAPLGQCMYCGATENLRTEHIVPYALDGNLEVPASSCIACERITGSMEQSVLRGELRALRLYRQLQSRRKHRDAPKTFPCQVIRNGERETLHLPITECPVLVHFPIFSPPRILSGTSGTGIALAGLHTVSFGENPEEFARRTGAQALHFDTKHRPVEFARMIAKVAYAMAVATGASSRLSKPSPVIPSILGQTDDVGQWVGTFTDPVQRHDGQLHRVAIIDNGIPGYLVGDVQLFCDSDTPRYGVILGEVSDGAI